MASGPNWPNRAIGLVGLVPAGRPVSARSPVRHIQSLHAGRSRRGAVLATRIPSSPGPDPASQFWPSQDTAGTSSAKAGRARGRRAGRRWQRRGSCDRSSGQWRHNKAVPSRFPAKNAAMAILTEKDIFRRCNRRCISLSASPHPHGLSCRSGAMTAVRQPAVIDDDDDVTSCNTDNRS